MNIFHLARVGRTDKVPVDEVPGLEVAHGVGDLLRHVDQYSLRDRLAVGVSEVVEQVPPRHELGHDIERRLPRAHAEELDQVGVPHLLHDGSLFEKVRKFHRVLLKEREKRGHEKLIRNNFASTNVLVIAERNGKILGGQNWF